MGLHPTTPTARVPWKTSAPASLAAPANPIRYLTGWNSAWSSRRRAHGTSHGRPVSAVRVACSPASRGAAASASTSATSSGEGAQTKAGLRRRSHSMPRSCASPVICATPASLASAYRRAASAPWAREISERASLCCEVTLAVE